MSEMTLPRPHLSGLRALEVFSRFARDPIGTLGRIKDEHGDRARSRIFCEESVLLSHPDDIAEVLVSRAADFRKDSDTQQLAMIVGEGLLTLEGDAWRARRKLAAPSLKRRQIEHYGAVMVRHAEALADAMLAQPDARDLHADMMGVTLRIVVECLLGADLPADLSMIEQTMTDLMNDFARLQQTWRRFVPAAIPTGPRRRIARSRAALDEVIEGVIARRRAAPGGDDLLSRLMAAQDEAGEGLDDGALRDEATTMFLAGHETTALTLTFALFLLGRHPEVRARIEAELDAVVGDGPLTAGHTRTLPYLGAVVDEVLRLYPPAWAIGREAIRDLDDLRVGPVRAGTQVYLSPWLIHRDARWFDAPERFDPERFLRTPAQARRRFTYLPFGAGPRVCIGNHFARMEAMLVLAVLLRRARIEVLAPAELRLRPSITLRPVDPILGRARPR